MRSGAPQDSMSGASALMGPALQLGMQWLPVLMRAPAFGLGFTAFLLLAIVLSNLLGVGGLSGFATSNYDACRYDIVTAVLGLSVVEAVRDAWQRRRDARAHRQRVDGLSKEMQRLHRADKMD